MKRCVAVCLLLILACDKTEPEAAPDPVTDVAAAPPEVTAPADVPPPGPPIPSDRPVLLFQGDSATASNTAKLPADWTGPKETQCAKDPTRAYIAELFKNGIADVQVLWHWAPVVSGPDAARPTLDQPEFALAGLLDGPSDGTGDELFSHPFGHDWNANIVLDPEFAFMAYGEKDGHLHAELELDEWPKAAFGFVPATGDRVLLQGAWIFDCGHPPYDTELHPPSFLAFARTEDPKTTISQTFFSPYRGSLLFNPDSKLVADFGNPERFTAANTFPFATYLINTIVAATGGATTQFEAPHLLAATRFDTLSWAVCAPGPRPAGATVEASWRFTSRTGVTVAAKLDEAAGCVRIDAAMGNDYTPMPWPYGQKVWPWDEMGAAASGQVGVSIDVRKEVIKALKALGVDGDKVVALQADHPPMIDAHPPLVPAAGADADAPTAITEHADDQPYPFYGRVRIAWK